MKVVIVGGVAAGMSAATRLRRLKEDAEIIVFEQGENVSYANCGLPYHVGEVIPAESDLLLQTPQSLKNRFNLDVRINSRVSKINPESKTVEVIDLKTKQNYSESYDYLVLATGAKPRALAIPGFEKAHVLREVKDATTIKAIVDRGDVHTAVILGAGFIGVELAENLRHRGIDTTIVQSRDRILPQYDAEIIEPMQAVLEENSIRLILNTQAIEYSENQLVLSDGSAIPADIVISAIGVEADHHLAVEAGLKIGEAGGIWVDDQMRTSNPSVFAVGDAAEKQNLLTDQSQMIWLANLANRQGRLVADVISGEKSRARKAIGTGIIGAFGLVAALTGLTEDNAKKLRISHRVIHLHPSSHAGYFPGAERISMKVLFDPESGKLLGAQAVGRDGVDKRIDVIATAIYAQLTIDDLMNLELSYAPAFGSAKDAVNQAGYVGNNVLENKTETLQWHELAAAQAAGATVIDVRNIAEHAESAIPGAVLIPLDELRVHLAELSGKDVIVHCQVGQRGHTAAQILRANGIRVRNLDGGYLTWRAGMDARARANQN